MKEWIEAFTKAQQAFPPIPKKRTARIKTQSGHYEYSYADLGDILEQVLPILHEHGLSVSQSAVEDDRRVGVETRIYHTGGHVEVFGPLFLDAGSTAQSAGSAVTYARRYALTAALGIATEDDDDGQVVTPERSDVEADGSEWLADAVQAFKEWTPEQRRETGAQVAREIGAKKPITLAEAREVKDRMAAIYYEQYPSTDEQPF